MNRKCSFVLASLLVSSAHSAVQIVENGLLIGAKNVDILGSFYNVSFIEGYCRDVFDDCDEENDFLFNATEASIAEAALNAQVVIDSTLGLFDSNIDLTFGCGGSSYCEFHIPYGFGNTAQQIIKTRAFTNYKNDIPDAERCCFSDDNMFAYRDSTANGSWVWASFTPVPIPATAWLFGSALLGLFGLRKPTI